MTVWILTFEINRYDQEGEYFLAVFKKKPTREILGRFFDEQKEATDYFFLDHVLKGGGRQEYENIWYNLKEVECYDSMIENKT